MAERTVRIDLNWSTLEAVSWAVWFSAPASPSTYQNALDEIADELLRKRRQFISPGAAEKAVRGPDREAAGTPGQGEEGADQARAQT